MAVVLIETLQEKFKASLAFCDLAIWESYGRIVGYV